MCKKVQCLYRSCIPIKAMFKKTSGNGTGCFKAVQKRAKQNEKYIQCEWRAGQKPDRVDDPQNRDEGSTECRFSRTFFKLSYLFINRSELKGSAWIKKTPSPCISEKVQMLSNITAINNFSGTSKQEHIKKSTTKKGLSNAGLLAFLAFLHTLTLSMLTNASKSSSNGAPSTGSGNL